MKKQVYRLRTELHIYFLRILLLVGVLISGMFMTYYSHRETAVIAEGKRWLLAQSVTYVDRIMEEVSSMGELIWTSSQVQGIKVANLHQTDYLYFRDCMDYLSNMEYSANSIYRIRLFDLETKTLTTSRNGVFYNLGETAVEYYSAYMNSIPGAAWIMDFDDGIIQADKDGGRFLYYVRPVYSIVSGDKIGLLCIDVPKSVFSVLVKQKSDTDGYGILGDGIEIIDAGQLDTVPAYLREGELPAGQIATYKAEGGSYTIVYEQSPYSGWLFYLYYPSGGLSFDWGILIVAGLLLCLVLIAAYAMIMRIFQRKVEEPIDLLLSAMKEFEEGNFGIQIEGRGKDLFGEIFRHFNHMSGRSQELVEELITERTKLKDGKLKMLQAQIKPHFLYNIFNSMIWMTEQKDYAGLEKMVYATAGYYKTSLNFGNHSICLYDNLKQLEYYGQIQEIRFPDKFRCDILFAEEIKSHSIPNLLLQPLLENAITHGAAGKSAQTSIQIKGYKKDGFLVFEFFDNGAGIEAGRLEAIRAAMAAADFDGSDYFALTNVAQRVRMYYQGRGKLLIDSIQGEWTRISLMLPEEECGCVS